MSVSLPSAVKALALVCGGFLLLVGIEGVLLKYIQKNTQEYLLSIILEFKVDNDSGQLGII